MYIFNILTINKTFYINWIVDPGLTVNIYVVHFHPDLIWTKILFAVVELKYFVKVEWPKLLSIILFSFWTQP